MRTIEERATEYRDKRCPRIEMFASLENLSNDVRRSMLFHCYEDYKTGAKEQKAIDIDKACEWLEMHLEYWLYEDGYIDITSMLKDFRKAMEE